MKSIGDWGHVWKWGRQNLYFGTFLKNIFMAKLIDLLPNISKFSNVTKYKFDFYEEWKFHNLTQFHTAAFFFLFWHETHFCAWFLFRARKSYLLTLICNMSPVIWKAYRLNAVARSDHIETARLKFNVVSKIL